jgi:hypothetical protein
MTEEVFGAKPTVIPFPYTETIRATGASRSAHAMVIAAAPGNPTVEAIRSKLADQFFWASTDTALNASINGYAHDPPTTAGARPANWEKVGMAKVDTTGIGPTPTDDWPFLYLRAATIPWLNLRGMAMVAACSLAILFLISPIRSARPDGRMFFLGAGFMLLETKGVVHMALLFGATWMVNSIVFFAILVMILLSNLFVLAFRPQRLGPYFALLVASLLVNSFVPMDYFLSLPGTVKTVASCAVVFVPVFFAGVIFAAAFRDSQRPDVAFGSNIGGVILGGLSENLSLVLGFDHLLLVAIGFYMLAALLAPRLRAAPAASIA